MAGTYRKTTQEESIEKKKITVYVVHELYEQIKKIALKHKQSMSSACEDIIEQHLGITFGEEGTEGEIEKAEGQ